MKPEKELLWLAKLYKSQYARDLLNLKGGSAGCKTDFLRCMEISDKNKEAHKFISNLISIGVCQKNGMVERGIGKRVFTYTIDGKLLVKYAKENKCFQTFKYLFNYDRII